MAFGVTDQFAGSSGAQPLSAPTNSFNGAGSLTSSTFGIPGFAQGLFQSVALNSAPSQRLPYKSSNIDSPFFRYIDLDASRWDQLLPYRLLVVDITNNKIVQGSAGSLSTKDVKIKVRTGTDTTIVEFDSSHDNSWIFQLPISPQQLHISDQFSIATTATLRGVLEEHNGVKFKNITASGTFGVWAYRDSISKPPSSPTILQSLFGGTIEAFDTLKASVDSVIRVAKGGSASPKPDSKRPDDSGGGLLSTGYYQALKLQQFLEQYVEAKKDPKNASWRLVFDIPKQNQSLVVTPVNYVWQQNANKPMEFMFSFQLKAWRRINLEQPLTPASSTVQSISPGILQRILNTLSTARQTTSAALNLIGAVTSDVEAPLNVLRQTSLFVKDLAGVIITAADLPFQLQRDYASSIAASMAILASSFSSTNSNPADRANLDHVIALYAQNEGLSLNAVAAGQLGQSATIAQTLNPASAIFNNPQGNFTLIDFVPVHSLALNNAQQNAVDTVIVDANQTTISDLKKFRAVIQNLALQLSNSFGTGSSYYSKVYSQSAPTNRIQPVTLDEYAILQSLYDVMQSYDILTATTQIDDDQFQSNMDYVAGLADTSGIQFGVPSSKIMAPVPFGLTIEGIAARYLGDAQRWLEIATLNNLRDPYIDENGFQYPLLSNATGRQITISTSENLYIGQRIILMGSSQVPSPRIILGLDRLSDTSFLITLDGLANLDNFTLSDNSYLQAYLPGTVNSQQKIFIPSNIGVSNTPNILSPSSTTSDPLTGLSKVDWLLTDAGDMAVNNYGDFRLSSGITNISQALKIKFSTFQGTALLHPTFGIDVRVGSSLADANLQSLYTSINNMIQQDPRFNSIDSLQIVSNGPMLGVNVGVTIPNQNGVFPLSFNLTS